MSISYIGGKSKISSFITPHIPKDIETFCEPFSGMFWVFLKMKPEEFPNLKRIVYNDYNVLNWNLWSCMREHKTLLEYCELMLVQTKGQDTDPLCSMNFHQYQKEVFDPNLILDEPNFEIAAKYAYVLTQVFSGANPEKAKFIDLKGKYHSKFTSFKNKLRDPKYQRLFEMITDVENMDFQQVIQYYDSESTYFYVDPPYYVVGEGNYYSNHNFNNNDHLRLADTLKSIEGRFSLSYYDFELLSKWFPKDKFKWDSQLFSKPSAAKKGVKQNKAEEILIMNYDNNK
jgi:DNA adenine methylase